MRAWIVVLLGLLGVLFAAPADAAEPRYDPENPAPQRDALGLLEHGHTYLEGAELPEGDSGSPTAFTQIDEPLAGFLEYPHLQPAVQFSCAVMATPGEERLVAALEGDDTMALIALAALLRVHSPSSVEAQLETLARLKKDHPEWKQTLATLEARFDAKRLARAIARNPPEDDRYGQVHALAWALRAVGARSQSSALPRVAKLCASAHLHTSLAAERSIEDFTGKDADEALAACIAGWQYDAADRALDTLKDRNPALVRETLISMALPPADDLYRYAAALIDVAAPSTVPRLIEIIPDLSAPGSAIGALEAHAAPRHRAKIVALVPRVDAEHRERLRALAEQLRGPPNTP